MSEVSFERNDRSDLESLQPTAELCAFYRARIAAFESERENLLDRLRACNPAREESHRTNWELAKRVEEVKDLQKVRFRMEHVQRSSHCLRCMCDVFTTNQSRFIFSYSFMVRVDWLLVSNMPI